MEYKAVQITAENTLHRLLDGINLIRSHNHDDRLCFFDNHKLCEHFGQREFVKEVLRKLTEPIDTHIVPVRPVESKRFQNKLFRTVSPSLIGVCKVFCLYAVRYHEYLNETEQSLKRICAVTVNLIDSFVQLHTRPLQLNLYQRQTIDKHSHIITIFILHIVLVSFIHSNLMCDLIGVPACIKSQKFGIYRLAVIQFKHPFLTENLCRFINRMIIQTEQNLVKFAVGQFCYTLCLNKSLFVHLTKLYTEIGKHIIIVCHINI